MFPDRAGRRPSGCAPGGGLTVALALILALPAAFTAAGAAKAATVAVSGVEGVAAWRGDLVPGVVVLAFTGPGPDRSTTPVAVSAGSAANGGFLLELKPGSYHLVAVRSAGVPWPFPGGQEDLFCYYLGNPILVEPGKLARVAFNMVRVGPPPAPVAGEGTGIAGEVRFGDKPLARAYVQVYGDPVGNFRGLGLVSVPAGADGRFRIKLPPGSYYVVARKRRGGGMYGPPGKDDFVGYHPGNPVTVHPGAFTSLALEATTRIDELEKLLPAQGAGAGWFQGTVTESGGKPAAGLYVLFYTDATLTGAPAFVAGPTDSEGRFKVRAAAGTFHLLARSTLGGPLEPGEWYGTARILSGGGALPGGVQISVSRYQGK